MRSGGSDQGLWAERKEPEEPGGQCWMRGECVHVVLKGLLPGCWFRLLAFRLSALKFCMWTVLLVLFLNVSCDTCPLSVGTWPEGTLRCTFGSVEAPDMHPVCLGKTEKLTHLSSGGP